MKKERYIVLCILVVLFILAIIVLFDKYVISANLQEGATNNFSSYFIPSDTSVQNKDGSLIQASTVFITKNPSLKPNVNVLADYTYYLVINPADVPGMESNASNYLNVTALPVANDIGGVATTGGDYYYQTGGMGINPPGPAYWETTTQEFALPLIPIKTKPSGLQVKIGFLNINWKGAFFGGQDGEVKAPLLRLNKDKIIQNPFNPPAYESASMTLIPDKNEYVARDAIEYKNLSSTDSGSTGLFVGYINILTGKTIKNPIPVYLVKGDFNPYKPKPVSYFDTSSYCNNKKIYIGAKEYTTISTTPGEDEESCAKKCEDDENCDMYLMQDASTCWTYKDVSGISMFCNKGLKPKPPHEFWGKFKSSIDMRDIVRYPESTAEQKAQQEQALAEQEAKEAQQEQALAETESQDARGEEAKYTSEEAKYTSEKAKYTSEEAKYTSEKAKFTSEEAKLTSEEERADNLKAQLLSYSNTISNLKDQLANCSKKTPTLGAMEFNPAPAPACIPDPNKPKPFNIHVHYSNYNASM
jgi:hypothetical protein